MPVYSTPKSDQQRSRRYRADEASSSDVVCVTGTAEKGMLGKAQGGARLGMVMRKEGTCLFCSFLVLFTVRTPSVALSLLPLLLLPSYAVQHTHVSTVHTDGSITVE